MIMNFLQVDTADGDALFNLFLEELHAVVLLHVKHYCAPFNFSHSAATAETVHDMQ